MQPARIDKGLQQPQRMTEMLMSVCSLAGGALTQRQDACYFRVQLRHTDEAYRYSVANRPAQTVGERLLGVFEEHLDIQAGLDGGAGQRQIHQPEQGVDEAFHRTQRQLVVRP